MGLTQEMFDIKYSSKKNTLKAYLSPKIRMNNHQDYLENQTIAKCKNLFKNCKKSTCSRFINFDFIGGYSKSYENLGGNSMYKIQKEVINDRTSVNLYVKGNHT